MWFPLFAVNFSLIPGKIPWVNSWQSSTIYATNIPDKVQQMGRAKVSNTKTHPKLLAKVAILLKNRRDLHNQHLLKGHLLKPPSKVHRPSYEGPKNQYPPPFHNTYRYERIIFE